MRHKSETQASTDYAPNLSATNLDLKRNSSDDIVLNRAIGVWLFACCGIIYCVVVVGGITRLTESGLSITEWKPILGVIPPLSENEWVCEFDKYKLYPEFKRIHSQLTLNEFKQIYFWEWMHRLLGRLIGVVFAIPFAYFIIRKRMSSQLLLNLSGILLLGAFQGALGWYMVQSGLHVGEGEWPRVSAYRLCAHLGVAFLIYLGIAWNLMNVIRPKARTQYSTPHSLERLQTCAAFFLGLCFLTAMSGAFVAGLDAGLVYNEFPFMGENVVPEEYWAMQPWWKNFFENSATAQFNHRVLGITTASASCALWYYVTRFKLDRPSRLAANGLLIMTFVQVGLGLSALLLHVPICVAALHQAGSLALLTLSIWLFHSLKKTTICVN